MGLRKEEQYDIAPKDINNIKGKKQSSKLKNRKAKEKNKFRFHLNLYIILGSLTVVLNFALPRVGDMAVNGVFAVLLIMGMIQYSNYKKRKNKIKK